MSIILPEWVARREELRAEEAKKKEPKPLLNLDVSDQPGHLEKFLEDKPALRSKLLNIIGKVMLRGEMYSHGIIAYEEFRAVLQEGGYDWEEWC